MAKHNYINEKTLEKAKEAIVQTEEYENRISSLRFIRFTKTSVSIYLVNGTSMWRRKTAVAEWQNMEAEELNQLLGETEWEDWL